MSKSRSQKGKAAKEKGKVGEREVVDLLKSYGYDKAKRGQQFKGTPDSPDVDGLPGFHIEVKRTETLSVYEAIRQAENDCTGYDEEIVPVVFHRRNGKRWLVIIDAEDFLDILSDRADVSPIEED